MINAVNVPFEDATVEAYLALVEEAAYHYQLAEVLARHGEIEESKVVRKAARLIKNRAICMKAALRQKEKAAAKKQTA